MKKTTTKRYVLVRCNHGNVEFLPGVEATVKEARKYKWYGYHFACPPGSHVVVRKTVTTTREVLPEPKRKKRK